MLLWGGLFGGGRGGDGGRGRVVSPSAPIIIIGPIILRHQVVQGMQKLSIVAYSVRRKESRDQVHEVQGEAEGQVRERQEDEGGRRRQVA